MASGELTSGAYIKHHLQNLTYGKFPDGHWGFAENAIEAKEMGFMALHVDTLGFSFIFFWAGLIEAFVSKTALAISRA